MSAKVTSQAELDKALADPSVSEITIDSPRGVWLEIKDDQEKYVEASGSSTVRAYGSSTVRASGSSTVRAYDSSTVSAYDSSTVSAYDSSTVSAYGSSTVSASGSSTVRAYDSSTVSAYDSSTVRAYGSSTVRASGSSTVSAYGSSTVSAYGSSTVRAYDSSTVRAYDSSTVSAYDSSTVSASGSSTVRASGSSTVSAYGSSTVSASGSSTVRASNYVAVHLHSAKVTIDGGVVIDVTKVKRSAFDGWAEYHGVEIIDGEAIVYKAVNDDLKSARGFAYPIGETVEAPDWEPGDFCGKGLHFSPTPHHANYYFESATRFLKVAVKLDELTVINGDGGDVPKLKAKGCRVIAEVDVHTREVVPA